MAACSCLENADICIIAGNNDPPVQWQFLLSEDPDVLLPIENGTVFKLTIRWPGGSIEHSSDEEVPLSEVPHSDEALLDDEVGYVASLDAITIADDDSIVAWHYTVAESRMLPKGCIATYELERWDGTKQQSLVAGIVNVAGGYNPD